MFGEQQKCQTKRKRKQAWFEERETQTTRDHPQLP